MRPGDGRGADAYLDRQPAFRGMERLSLQETAIHFVDLFSWLFGPVVSVWASIRRLNPAIAGGGAGLMILIHAGGAVSTFDGNRLADHPTDNPRRTMGTMRIEGEGGTLTLDGTGTVRFRRFGARHARRLPLVAPVDEASSGGGCVEAPIRDAVAARRDPANHRFENRAAAYIQTMRVIDAAYAAAREGRTIFISREVL